MLTFLSHETLRILSLALLPTELERTSSDSTLRKQVIRGRKEASTRLGVTGKPNLKGLCQLLWLPRWHSGTVVKSPPANTGDARHMVLIPGLGRFPGGGNGNLLQCSCLEDSMDTGAWQSYSPWSRKVRHG